MAADKLAMGLSDELLEAFQKRLEPGTSALVMVIEHETAQRLTDVMADVGGIMLQETLSREMVQQLLKDGEREAGDKEHV